MKKIVSILTLCLVGAAVPVMASSVEEKPTETKTQTPVTPSSVTELPAALSDDDFDTDAFIAASTARHEEFLKDMRIAEEEFQRILADLIA